MAERRLVSAFVRNVVSTRRPGREGPAISLLMPESWPQALRDCSVFIHCAGRAHITKTARRNDLREFRKANVDLTLDLAHQEALAGVRKFIFISSLAVNGGPNHDRPYTFSAIVNHHTSYVLPTLAKSDERRVGKEVVCSCIIM